MHGPTCIFWANLTPFSLQYYDSIAATLKAHPAGSALSWITESAYSCGGPANESKGGPNAALDPMLRAVDITWYLDALGAAARSGVDVFCKKTLVGDWLETIRSWQGAAGKTQYGPHPDFWVAALWAKLMGRSVLDVTVLGNATSLRAYAHCGRQGGAKSVVTVALANVGNEALTVDIASAIHGDSGATLNATQYVLAATDPGADKIKLNGQGLDVTTTDDGASVHVHIPSLSGTVVQGGAVQLPRGAVAFVQAQIPSLSSSACDGKPLVSKTDDTAAAKKHIDWYCGSCAASFINASTPGAKPDLVDGILPCCGGLPINCSSGQINISRHNFSSFAPFIRAVSDSLVRFTYLSVHDCTLT
jgi:hypothetical protein